MDESWLPQSPIITVADLPQLFMQHPIVAVHFWAVWNGLDRRMDETIQTVRKEFTQEIGFYALDVDKESNREFIECITQTSIMSIPLIVGFVGGEFKGIVRGAVHEEVLHGFISKWVAAAVNILAAE